MKASLKTTIAGIITMVIAILTAVAAMLDGNPDTVADWGAVGVALSVGIGLLFARDNSVSSEKAGAE
jgi:hypothetical protein